MKREHFRKFLFEETTQRSDDGESNVSDVNNNDDFNMTLMLHSFSSGVPSIGLSLNHRLF